MKIFVCSHCGSKYIYPDGATWDESTQKRRVEWDKSTQEWRLSTLYESGDCDNCEAETWIIEKEIE